MAVPDYDDDMQRVIALLLCLVLVAGCGSFHFVAFGVPLDDFGDDLTAEETAGTILLIAIVVAVSIGGAALYD